MSFQDHLAKNHQIDQKKNLLLIGGTSSLSELICNLAISEGFQVFSTYRDERKLLPNPDVNWVQLDFKDIPSVKGALSYLSSLEFSRVIYLVGELSDLQNNETDLVRIDEYFRRNITAPIWFLKSLFESRYFTEMSTFTYLSSRASQFGSNDYCYGIAKASIENFIKSLSLLNLSNLEVKIVYSGLILDSGMQRIMPSEVVKNHIARSMDELIHKDLASNRIWEIANTISSKSLETFQIGPNYL